MSDIYGSLFDYGQSPLYKDDGTVTTITATETDVLDEGDVKLVLDSGILSDADIQIAVRDLLRDAGFETALLISLFTDRRAGAEDVLPDNSGVRRGFWGDALNKDNDADGSKLWLLTRAKITDETVTRVEEYCTEALQWMIDDGVAQTITVTAGRSGTYEVSWIIEIQRPAVISVSTYKYFYNWQNQIFGRK
jgi:phage gp46-like protein